MDKEERLKEIDGLNKQIKTETYSGKPNIEDKQRLEVLVFNYICMYGNDKDLKNVLERNREFK